MARLEIRKQYVGEYRQMQIDHDCASIDPDGATGTMEEMVALREWVCGCIDGAGCDLQPEDVGSIEP
jgi:hypothetical protein